MKKLIALVLIIVAGFFGYKHFFAKSEVPEGVDKIRYTTCTVCRGNSACWRCNGDAYRDGRRCGNCDGTGKCTNCFGAGKYMVYVIDGQDYVECGACHKKGACGLCDGARIKDYGSMF